MKRLYCALRFFRDDNLSDRLYWYLCDDPLKEGDKVLAPVGIHDRLQEGIVERLSEAEDERAPYDLKLIKRVEAVSGARILRAGETKCYELGGIRYDNRHFTRFSIVLFAKERPKDSAVLRAYGVEKIIDDAEPQETCRLLLHETSCVLLTGEKGEKLFEGFKALARGDLQPLLSCGVREETLCRLREKIT